MKRIFLIFFFLLFISGTVFAQRATLDWRLITTGKVRQVFTNSGWLNAKNDPTFTFPGLINCEYPIGTKEEHITEAGPWIAAMLDGEPAVTVVRGEQGECWPSDQPWDTIWVVKRNDTIDIGDPLNPYKPGYIGVSDMDFVCRYNDYGPVSLKDVNHVPLYLEFVQTIYSWGSKPLDEVIVVNYEVTSTKYDTLKVYLCNWMNGNIGYGLTDAHGLDDETYFDKPNTMAIVTDVPGGEDGTAVSPIGQKSYFPPAENGDSTLTFIWYNGQQQAVPFSNLARWIDMTKGVVMENQISTGDGTKHIVAQGPYTLLKGDTLRFSVALILGAGMDGVYENLATLNKVRAKNFRVPSAPPKPPLRIYPTSKSVKLDWHTQPGEINPETYTDPNRADTVTKPFQGYRVYKSTKSSSGPWTLLAEFDKPGDDYGSNLGLEYEYTDLGLVNNIEYYYAVTSFSIPDKVLNFPALESSISLNSLQVVPGTPPPESVDEVAVVPNPYRGDIAYNNFDPPWEKPKGSRDRWMEQDRRIQFINLPAQCEIRIYTLSGDPVFTIYHDDQNKGYEDWNLTSSAGQAISSGIYLYTVEDKITGKVHVDKFVVIK